MIEAGLVTWCLLIGMNVILVGFLRHQWREHPYLFAYLAYRLVRSAVIFPLFYNHQMSLYSRLYWATDPLLLGLGIYALGEMFADNRQPVIWFFGCLAFTSQLFMVWMRDDKAIRIEGWVWIFCACVAAVAMLRRPNLLAAGFVMLNFFPAISGRLEVLLHGEGLRMVPVFSLAAAYSLWIVWAYRLQKWSPEIPIL